MPTYETSDIRNIALVGHGGCGKTTLVEALLHRTGAIGHQGSVDKGDTVCDFDPLEKQHKHSLSSAIVSIDHAGRHINLIDTPGYPDFMGQAMSILPAVETVAVVISAQAGIEMVTRRLMERAAERKLCRAIIINKIDADNIDLPALLANIRETFGAECLPVNLPANGGKAVVDVFGKAEGESDFSSVAEAHTAIIDQVVEVDEKLMEKYLEQGEVSPEQLHDPFEKALRDGHLVPVCFVSAETGVGVPELLDIMANLMPNPMEGNPRPFVRGEGPDGTDFRAVPDPTKHAIAHVFKILVDPFLGRLSVFRIHQGRITKDSQLFIGNAKKPFKVGHLFKLQGKDHKEIDAGIPGDLCSVAKVEDIEFDDVLHDSHDEDHIHLRPLSFPTPMQGLAIETKSRGDEQKLARALAAMASEDPCVKAERNADTNELVLRGMGDLHLRIVLEKIKDRFHVEVNTRPPKIAYKETIQMKAEGHHRHKKQTGGAGQFGEVYLRVEPLERGSGFEFVNDVFGGSVPSQFIPAIEKGVRQVIATGCIAGYQMQDIRVSVYDGKHHPVDSKEIAFVTAGKRAFIDAVQKAKPAILEPIVSLEVVVPDHNMGDISGDLSGKRGRIMGTDTMPGGMMSIKAQAPLAELTMYQSQLKSVTGGQGSYTMELSHYEPVPPFVQQQIVAQYKPHQEED